MHCPRPPSRLTAFALALLGCVVLALEAAAQPSGAVGEPSTQTSPAAVRFKKPSELSEPPGLVIAPPEPPPVPNPAPSAAPPIAEVIHVPTVETIDAKSVDASTDTPPATNEAPAEPRLALGNDGIGPVRAGTGWDFGARQLLSKATSFRAPDRTVATATPARPRPTALAYARGFYSYLSSNFADSTGVQVVGDVDVHEGVRVGGLLHHELRDRPGQLGRVQATTTLIDPFEIGFAVSAGSGVHFLPTTELAADLRAFIPDLENLELRVGGSASWWTRDRVRGAVFVGGGLWLDPELQLELRQHLSWTDSPRTDLRLFFRTEAAAILGQHGHVLAELRFDVGNAPAYRQSALFDLLESRVYLGGSLSVRYWIGDGYGALLSLTGGGQLRTLFHAGADAAVFIEL